MAVTDKDWYRLLSQRPPAGTYVVFFALTRAGTLDLVSSSEVSVTFSR